MFTFSVQTKGAPQLLDSHVPHAASIVDEVPYICSNSPCKHEWRAFSTEEQRGKCNLRFSWNVPFGSWCISSSQQNDPSNVYAAVNFCYYFFFVSRTSSAPAGTFVRGVYIGSRALTKCRVDTATMLRTCEVQDEDAVNSHGSVV